MYMVVVTDRVGDKSVSYVYSKHDTIDGAQAGARQALKDGYVDISIEKIVPWHK